MKKITKLTRLSRLQRKTAIAWHYGTNISLAPERGYCGHVTVQIWAWFETFKGNMNYYLDILVAGASVSNRVALGTRECYLLAQRRNVVPGEGVGRQKRQEVPLLPSALCLHLSRLTLGTQATTL